MEHEAYIYIYTSLHICIMRKQAVYISRVLASSMCFSYIRVNIDAVCLDVPTCPIQPQSCLRD